MQSKNLVTTVLICTLLIFVTAFAVFSYKTGLFKSSPGQKKVTPTSVIAKVGNEELYQKDLDFEISQSPQKDDPAIKQILLNKMVLDSIILQGAESDHLITLDSTIYSSADKDYLKRVAAVETAKLAIKGSTDTINGYVVSIWYHNNSWVGPMGLERSKQTAYEKIKKLHDEVISGRITIQEAGARIKADTSIVQLDKAYKSNAIFGFESLKGSNEQITLNKDLDIALWSLKQGGTTDIYPGQAIDLVTKEKYDALYFFGQVTSRKSNGGGMPFDPWLESKKKIYDVMFY